MTLCLYLDILLFLPFLSNFLITILRLRYKLRQINNLLLFSTLLFYNFFNHNNFLHLLLTKPLPLTRKRPTLLLQRGNLLLNILQPRSYLFKLLDTFQIALLNNVTIRIPRWIKIRNAFLFCLMTFLDIFLGLEDICKEVVIIFDFLNFQDLGFSKSLLELSFDFSCF